IQREFWVLNSEAYFKLQFIMGMILAPIVSLIYFLLIQSEWLPAYVNMTDNENFTMYYFYFILFLSTMNNISGTPYSREGKYHYLLNSTPLNSRFIYFTKVFVASSMSMISILLSFLFLIGFGYWEADAIVMLLIISGLAFIYNLLTPIYDRKNPVIVWETPSTAIKSNPNVLVSLLYGMPILVVICILHFALMWIHIPPYINYIIVLFGIIITIFLLIKRIIKKEKMGVK